MVKLISILWNSFKMALQELKVNKLRTTLSLFGITIGIFCIISVLSTIDSLQAKVQSDIKALGNNTIYIDKFSYGGGPDNPWWKYNKRPTPKYEEMKFLKEKTQLASNICFFIRKNANLNYGDNVLSNSNLYGITEEFNSIQTIDIALGRYFSDADFDRGLPNVVIGYGNAEDLFGEAERAIGKEITFYGKRATVIGLIKKQGSSILDGFDYDHCILVNYRFFASIYSVENSNPTIMVQAKNNIPTTALMDELEGNMRQVRKLSPTTESDFALNDLNALGEATSGFFASVNLGGWVIAGLSLVVGAFGVANIMFVTVRERTSQIGLKKAIGAKRSTILIEFLLESAFLCVIGGLIGLFLVWLLTTLISLSGALPFAIVIAPKIIILALSICIILGILSGIIPAYIAAKMDPVVAIRTK
jgi:putative ABC transport system permease protein